MKQRNVMIEIWRLIFSFLIVICHTVELPWYSPEVRVTRSTSIGVEFFFIISGYLKAKSASTPPPPLNFWSDIRGFLFKKLKTIYPTYLFALVLGNVAELLLPRVAEEVNLLDYVYFLWDVLFLRATGLRGESLKSAVPASWYLSAMILAMALLYPLIRKFYDAFQTMIAPLLSVFILGWFAQMYKGCGVAFTFKNGICLGLLRGISEICVGCVCFSVAQWLKGKQLERPIRFLATVAEEGAFCAVVAISYFFGRSYMDYISIFLIAVGVSLSFSGITFTSRLSEKLQLRWVGSFSLALYLTHLKWAQILGRWKIPIPFRSQIWILLALSVASALACVYTLELITRLYRAHKERKLQVTVRSE